MAKYYLPIVLKIKEAFDGMENMNYSLNYEEDAANFIWTSCLPSKEYMIEIQMSVKQDDDGKDLISVLAKLYEDYDTDCIDELEGVVSYANESTFKDSKNGVSAFFRQNDDDKINMYLEEKYYFDESVCDDEQKFDALIKEITGNPVNEFVQVSPYLAVVSSGEEGFRSTIERIQSMLNDASLRSDGDTAVPAAAETENMAIRLAELKKRAGGGNVKAQLELGRALQELDHGELPKAGTAEDMTPVYWYNKAADKRSCEAYYCLACCYQNGWSVARDLETACSWYNKVLDYFTYRSDGDAEQLKASLYGLEAIRKELGSSSEIVFPIKYGSTTFESMDEVIEQYDSNPDALGFYSQCSVFGIGVMKSGTLGINGLFAAANAGSVDAIVGLGRLYETGYEFLAKDIDSAVTLYKYAYSLKNADGLYSLGHVLFTSSGKKDIGLSMIKKAAELGSRSANIQLGLMTDELDDVQIIFFSEIPKKEFEFDEFELADCLQLYGVDLSNTEAIKDAFLDVMANMKPETFSVIMNEFRVKYLRRRKLMYFDKMVNFRKVLNSMVKKGTVETWKVGDYGVVEDTLYRAKASTQKMKSVTLDWDI